MHIIRHGAYLYKTVQSGALAPVRSQIKTSASVAR